MQKQANILFLLINNILSFCHLLNFEQFLRSSLYDINIYGITELLVCLMVICIGNEGIGEAL